MKKVAGIVVPIIGMMLLCFSGCGKNNNLFSFSHSAGSNTDTKALMSDANTALQEKDWQKALEYYEKILAQDSDNAEAIYGAAAAELAAAGLDIASLVTNMVKENSESFSAPNLSAAIKKASHNTSSSSGNILPDSILSNLRNISDAIEHVLSANRLPRIVNGQADGSISPENADVNLNLAFCYVLHAAIILNDTVEFNTDYEASVKSGVTSEQLQGVANLAAEDLVKAYNCLKTVVVSLNLADDGTIAEINDNVKDLFDQYKSMIENDYHIDITASIN